MRYALSDEFSYSHLLGLYLGDGCIASKVQLRITCGNAHPGLIADAAVSLRLIALSQTLVVRSLERSPTLVECRWARWPDYFPQMGPGRKHERPIVLEPWQQAIVDREPEAFLAGSSSPHSSNAGGGT